MKKYYKKKEKKINKDFLKNLIQAKNYYGSFLKDLNPNSYNYLYGIRNKQSIINLNYTIQTVNRSFLLIKKLNNKKFKKFGKKWKFLKFFKKSIKKEKKILIIANNLKLKLLKDSFLEHFSKDKIKYISKDWIGGLITNPFLMDNLLKNTKLIISFNETKDNILIKEALKIKIPLISVTDTDNNPDLIDYPIVSNCKNIVSIFFLMFLFKKYFNKLKY